jgi:preprotein translocase subunit YajC
MMEKLTRTSAVGWLLTMLFMVLLATPSFAQTGKVTGTVVDADNQPIIGASVVASGGHAGTVTDLNGHFSLNVKPGTTLQITYVGFKSVTVKAGSSMQVVMQEENNTLNEVVAIGYGSVKRKDVTTAVSMVSAEDLSTRPIVSAVQGMEGKAAGLQVSQASGTPGATPTIRVRGTTSLNGRPPSSSSTVCQ